MIVIGTIPSFPNSDVNHREQEKRMDVILTSRAEMDRMTDDLRINKALTYKFPAVTRYYFFSGQSVREYREYIQCWEGPFEVVQIEGK